MILDFNDCDIRTPAESDRGPLYQILAEQFPSDGPVFQEFLEHQGRLYTWVPYTLCRSEEILGNVSLMPMRVWFEGRLRQIVGIASVATRPQYRGCGIAKHLLRHCLELVDRQQLPCALFTGLPRVYEGAGFRTVEQRYLGVPAKRLRFEESDAACTELESLDHSTSKLLAVLYARSPSYVGKLDRDPDYWPLYRILFNAYPRVRLAVVRSGDEARGYVRWETENDRLLISELCAEPNDDRLIRLLLDHVAGRAESLGLPWITLALPPDHFVRLTLEDRGIALAPEPPGSPREPFMVRPPRGESPDAWGRLPWSLADKF
jgi:predicted acetyltransferase